MTIADHPDPPSADPRPPRSLDAAETWQVGRVRITKFVELAVPIPGEMMLPEATTDVVLAHRSALGPYATDDGWLTFSVHGFVLDDGERRILVDGGIGNAKSRPQPWFDHLDTPVLETMAAAGYPAESIDLVVATHLHADHVGWFTRSAGDGWVPTFPSARHLVVGAELDHWTADRSAEAHGPYLADSVDPLLGADLVDRVEPDHVLTAEVRLRPTPGHSPGHVSVVIESGGEVAVITGDAIHHPIQVLEPGWDGPFDEDVVVSAETRRALLDDLATTGALVLGTHVATPSAGHIVATVTGWRWEPVPDDSDRSDAPASTDHPNRRPADTSRAARFRFWAAGYDAVVALGEQVGAAGLEPRLLELVRLRASQLNRCGYCLDVHSKEARAAGEDQGRLDVLAAWREAPCFDDRERSALALTEAVTLVAGSPVPDAVVDAAAEHFSRDELSKLVYAIVEINAWNRLAITFGAPSPGTYELADR